MSDTVRELSFDAVVTVATGLALAASLLGVLLDPLPAIGVGGLLVVAGAVVLVPREAWIPAALTGLVTVGVAGVLIPRFVVEFTRTTAEMTVTLVLSAVVLLLAFLAVRLTAFRSRQPRPA